MEQHALKKVLAGRVADGKGTGEDWRVTKAHPERYEDLKVRVCGWNVRWNDLPRPEQDKCIERAEAVAP